MKIINKLVAASAVVCGVSQLSANTITPELAGFVPGVAVTYDAKHSSGELHPGDGFTIFDIGGFTGLGPVPLGWVSAVTVGSPFSPPAPGGVDGSDANVTFTYTGAPLETVVFSTTFPGFVVFTKSTSLVTDDWVSKDHLLGIAGVIDGGLSSGKTDQILVPAHVPDGGATAVLLGLGLLGAVGIRRKLS